MTQCSSWDTYNCMYHVLTHYKYYESYKCEKSCRSEMYSIVSRSQNFVPMIIVRILSQSEKHK